MKSFKNNHILVFALFTCKKVTTSVLIFFFSFNFQYDMGPIWGKIEQPARKHLQW